MRLFHWTLAALLVATANGFGQEMDFGQRSEADRFTNNLRRNVTADSFKRNLVRNATTAKAGWGVRPATSPTYSNLTGGGPATAPPRAQSASFGVSSTSPAAKPFSAITPRPTVSPYLGLFDNSIGEYNDLNYQTIVRPQVQQQQFNEQVVRQAQSINRRLTSISARNAYQTTGNQNVMPTGHAATFQNYSRFYPQQQQQRR